MKGMKVIWGGEWISVRNGMNKMGPPAPEICSMCRRGAVKMVWYSIKTGEVRCKKCFTPDGV